MQKFDKKYWDSLFEKNKLGWDIGYPSPPLVEYFNQIKNKKLKILIPGAGNAYEAEYLHKKGFENVFVLDFSDKAIASFLGRYPHFPENKIIVKDFFDLNDKFDLIVEQTFFTSFEPAKRKDFAKQMADLLYPNGKFAGLFFTEPFNLPYPPFAAYKDEYLELFSPFFDIKTFEIAYNSIKPRKNREYFFIMIKKINLKSYNSF